MMRWKPASRIFPPLILLLAFSRALLVLALVIVMMIVMAIPQGVSANPELKALGSLFLPGVGQAVNEDYGEAAAHFGISMFLAGQYIRLSEDEKFIDYDDRVDEKNHYIDINRTSFEADLYGFGLLNLSFYSAYGAYRDARNALGNKGYETPAPSESLGDLALAPFDPDYLSRPTTYLPLLVPLYLALTEPDEERFLFRPDDTISRDEMAVGYFGLHEMVAVGEESFFRGVLNNGLSDGLGDNWGLASSSVLFGLAHSGTGGQATPVGATLFGAYLGYLQQQNGFLIGQGVAIHFWWNFLITLGMLHERAPEQTVPIFTFYTRF